MEIFQILVKMPITGIIKEVCVWGNSKEEAEDYLVEKEKCVLLEPLKTMEEKK